MLHAADRTVDQDLDVIPTPYAHPVAVRPVPAPEAWSSPSRYSASGSPNWLLIGFILAVHAVLIAAVLHVRQEVLRRDEARLTVVNLTPPAAPPPAADTPPPPTPDTPEVVAPAPVVQVPTPPLPQVATTPVAQAPAPKAAAAAAPAVAMAPPAPPSVMQGGDLSAQMIAGKPPRYPVESRRKREQGTVVLALTLGLDGTVESLTISHSSGFSRLDEAARDAVRKWRWRPMVQQGSPVKVKGVVEIPFVLQIGTT